MAPNVERSPDRTSERLSGISAASGDQQTSPAAYNYASMEPIAIVGYACRLPGGVSSPQDLWDMCKESRTGWSEIPEQRFSKSQYWHPNPSRLGTFNPIGGHFLKEDVARFDASFFGITALEAVAMDPQQRLILETAFEALENSGIPRDKVAGTPTGVFVGATTSDYDMHTSRDIATRPTFSATGCAAALLSNRISYTFDLRGPSVTYDTACSASLVALHHAAQSIRVGECTQAIVGGCHLNLLPDNFVTMSLSQLFNDDGKTYAFDHRGESGFARGEGIGCVILKPLSAALRDRDSIRAVLASSGINQDGRTRGITVPNGEAQRDLIKSVYVKAGLDHLLCGYAELHGTGTRTGDPIETNAIHRALTEGRDKNDPLYIGSVKSNIGHLEGASGLASFIKATLMLEKNQILPTANFEKARASIPLEDWNLKVATETAQWPEGKKYVSVSNYGIGGTNAHAVLQKAPQDTYQDLGGSSSSEDVASYAKLIVVSAADQESLKKRIEGLEEHLEKSNSNASSLTDLAYTLGQRRSHLASRVAISASSNEELLHSLASAKAGLKNTRVMNEPTIGFVFTGQGAQWAQMGVNLMSRFPAFAVAIKQADVCLQSLEASFSLYEELQKPSATSSIGQAHISQPLCTAVQIALVDLLASWNVFPTSVVGHSSGEIACAYAAGIITAETAMKLAFFRGKATQALRTKFPELSGSMLAVGTSRKKVDVLLPKLKSYAVIACVNSPENVTVSGDTDAILELQSLLDEDQIFNRRLKVDMAYHSDHMAKVADEYLTALNDLTPCLDSKAAFFSSLLGRVAQPEELTHVYWVADLLSPVLFSDALSAMFADESQSVPDILIEIGPHPALKAPIRETLNSLGDKAIRTQYEGTLVRQQNDQDVMLRLASALFSKGVDLNLEAVNFGHLAAQNQRLLTNLPTYPWNHNTRYWHESRVAQNHLHARFPRNDILGSMTEYSNDLEPTWRNILRVDDLPWLLHHKMQGLPVFPMAGFIVMAVEAASQRAQMRALNFDSFELRNFNISQALVFKEEVDVEVMTSLRSHTNSGNGSEWDEFKIFSHQLGGGWVEHASGSISVRSTLKPDNGVQSTEEQIWRSTVEKRKVVVEQSAKEKVDCTELYKTLESIGAGYGPTFQGIENTYSSDHHVYGDLIVPNTKRVMYKEYETPLVVHPATLDIFLQVMWAILGAGRRTMDALYMPTSVEKIVLSRDIATQAGDKLRLWGSGSPDRISPRPTAFNIFATRSDRLEDTCISFENLVATPVRNSLSTTSDLSKELCFAVEWEAVDRVAEPDTPPMSLEIESDQDIKRGTDTPMRLEIQHHDIASSNPDSAIEMVNKVDSSSTLNLTERIIVAATTGSDVESAATIASSMSFLTGAAVDYENLDSCDVEGKLVIVVGLHQPCLANADEKTIETLKRVFLQAKGVLWVYPGSEDDPQSADSSMIVGLTRTIRSETGANIVTLGVESHLIMNPLVKVLQIVWSSENDPHKADREFYVRDGKLCVPRVVEHTRLNQVVHNELQPSSQLEKFDQPGRRLKLVVDKPGSLDDTFHFVDDEAELKDDEIEIDVKATGVNFKDVEVAMGHIHQPYLGLEVAGVVKRLGKSVNTAEFTVGQRVMAMSEGGYCQSTYCHPNTVSAIPDNLSFEDACGLPVIYCTALYSLIDIGRLAKDEKILIHAAAGGVGQAAIILAKSIGAEIFATVSTPAKKQLIMDLYGLPDDHVFYSRDTSFGPALRQATDGYGVDLALNSLAGDLLRETWDCIAPFGRFIEIGKTDIMRNSQLDMKRFENNITFSSVDLFKIAKQRPQLMKRLLTDVSAMLKEGKVTPIPSTTYPISEIEQAFRALQGGKSTGKLVVVPGGKESLVKVKPKASGVNILQPNASYLIVGGTGGLGCSMAVWMAKKGARHIILTSRQGAIPTEVQEAIDQAKTFGATILVMACDVTDANALSNLVEEQLKHLPPIRGVVQSAMVLRDGLFENLQQAQWSDVVKCKVTGTWNLHHALQNSRLDFFVCLGSVTGTIGNRGQSAYAAANVFLDNFARWRNSQRGAPGTTTTIDLFAVRGVGYLAREKEREEEVLRTIRGEPLVEAEVLALLAAAIKGEMNGGTTQDALGNGVCITGLQATPATYSLLGRDTRFSRLLQAADNAAATQGGAPGVQSLSAGLRAANTKDEALQVIYDALVHKIAAVLMLEPEEVAQSHSILATGLDSLVAIEVRNWIVREADAKVQILELQTSSSLKALAKTIVENSGAVSSLK